MATVYSTDKGLMCPDCQQVLADCRCKLVQRSGSSDGVVRIRRETKGRKGKGVTVIEGLAGSEAELKTLAKQLRQHCGSGGSLTDKGVEIQGDHREKAKAWLEKKGHSVKLSGG